MTLNQGQEASAQDVFQFLLSDDRHMVISGPAGVGKTFLMKHIKHTVLGGYKKACKLIGIEPIDYEVVMTATTNKATEVLAEAIGEPAQTIHSFMNLKVFDDFETGQSGCKPKDSWMVHSKKLIFVDECSMVDKALYDYILKGTDKHCKIIYVGDHCQMAPVFEEISQVYLNAQTVSFLTEPVRNAGQPALMALCQQLRNTVETGIFQPIVEVPGVIDYLSDDQAFDFINQQFAHEQTESRVLCYTNDRTKEYNNHIRELRGYSDLFVTGETVISNSAMTVGKDMIKVEQELIVEDVVRGPHKVAVNNEVELDVYTLRLRTKGTYKSYELRVPMYPDHLKELTKHFARLKEWRSYYKLKNEFPDLRQKDAATVYKAQGSTYVKPFLDLTNIGTCKNASQAARMLYVGASRATTRLLLYGSLPPRYCGA